MPWRKYSASFEPSIKHISIQTIQTFLCNIHWRVTEVRLKLSMTTKRTTKSESVSAGSAPTNIRKPRRSSAMHSTKPVASVATPAEPAPVNTEAIAELAYSYYEARGYAGGSPEEDWFRAERELMNR